ncbi:Ig-like domain-containing protein [Acidothermaceae bacterium B102]|nr:Ig-like domain-containing protein [Acidothermaceae bacterium B102]
MKRRVLRPVAVGIATLSTMATMVVGAVSSQAAQIGTFSFTPSTGLDVNSMTLDTSAACPGGTNFQIAVTGSGFPAAGYNVTANNADTILPGNAAGGYTIGLLDTMANFALAQSPAANLAGNTYTFTGTCKNGFGASTFGTFVGQIAYDATKHFSVVAQSASTTTALASTPASPVTAGVSVAFTAAVTASAGTAAGTVQLFDGATAIGSPTAVDASGLATISTAFSAGNHSITAAFTGASGFGNSVSTAIAYVVNPGPADNTNTALSISPATASSVAPVTLTASVTDTTVPASKPAGAVQFADGGVNLGSPVAVTAAGTAALTQTFTAGPHSFTASFVPTNAALFNPSASTSQAYTVTAFAGVTASEVIETTINAGALTISVADNSKVVLPSPVLNAAGTYLTTASNNAASRLHAVTVTDTRAGNPGWVASGQVSDFQNTTGPTTTPIAGVNLGWSPFIIDSSSGAVVAGPVVLPATAPLAADPGTATAGVGLQVSRTLATAAAGAGTGTTHVDAALALNVPTTVVAGTYDATLTLTAI